jgi:hypothetical protein
VRQKMVQGQELLHYTTEDAQNRNSTEEQVDT